MKQQDMSYESELITGRRDVEPIIAEAALNLEELFSLPRCTMSMHSWLFISVGVSQAVAIPDEASGIPGDFSSIESLTSTEFQRLEDRKSSASITTYIRELTEKSYQNGGCIEVRFVCAIDHLDEPIKTDFVHYICTSSVKFDEAYLKHFIDLLHLCAKARKRGEAVHISFGWDREQSSPSSKCLFVNNGALFPSVEGSSVCCAAARVSITSASVFAHILAGLVGETRSHSNPLASIDRLLPGISQICCSKTMRVLFAKVDGVLNNSILS